MTRRSPSLLLCHVVWATARRRPLIEPAYDRVLLGLFAQKAYEHGCQLVAGGCADDHVHTILKLRPCVALAELVHRLKGGSAYQANRHPHIGRPLYWQSGYWAESLSPADLGPLSRYVRSQRTHHDASHPAERWLLCD